MPDPKIFDGGEAGCDDGSLIAEPHLEEVGREGIGPRSIDGAVVTLGAAAEAEQVADEREGIGC